MSRFPTFALPLWIDENQPGSEVSLAGSLGPGLTLKELTSLSKDPQGTAKALKFDDVMLAGGTGEAGGEELRERVAELYDQSNVNVTADDVVITPGTTGANFLALQSLLSPGDHVISLYPSYGALLSLPTTLGATISHWRLNDKNSWQANLTDLKALLTPKTKLLILNNPNNPTGSLLFSASQADILNVAAEHNIVVLGDEIFRPLFHTDQIPASIVEHDFYDRTIVTGSVSKAWCFSGVRIGWCVTRNRELRDNIIALREWTVQSTSTIDEMIATEILGERCKQPVHDRISAIARENLALLRSFVAENKEVVKCNLPTAASMAFVQFCDPESGQPVDDVEFCRQLKAETGVLLSPGSLCFGDETDFKGYTRMHLTVLPEKFKKGIEGIAGFLRSKSFAALNLHADRNGM